MPRGSLTIASPDRRVSLGARDVTPLNRVRSSPSTLEAALHGLVDSGLSEFCKKVLASPSSEKRVAAARSAAEGKHVRSISSSDCLICPSYIIRSHHPPIIHHQITPSAHHPSSDHIIRPSSAIGSHHQISHHLSAGRGGVRLCHGTRRVGSRLSRVRERARVDHRDCARPPRASSRAHIKRIRYSGCGAGAQSFVGQPRGHGL